VALAVIAALLWRRVTLAMLLLALPGGLYMIWQRAYPPLVFPVARSMSGTYAAYAAATLAGSVTQLLQVDVRAVAWLLLAAATMAAVEALVRGVPSAPVFVASLCGAAFFCVSVASQRAGIGGGRGGPQSARYLHVATALLLPSMALLVDRLVTLRRWTAAAALVVVVFVLPANVRSFLRWNESFVAAGRRIRARVAASAALGPRLALARGDLKSYGPESYGLTVDSVRRLAAELKLPCDATPADVADLARELAVPLPDPASVACPP